MTRFINGLVAGALAIQLLPGGAWAAPCANGADTAALRIAALQQELMVAALSCHDIARYNSFVLSHQPELQASDAKLKAFFVARGRHGEEGYHTYKTELANDASLISIRDSEAFCARTSDEFDSSASSSDLSEFVGARHWSAADRYPVCAGGIIETADADVRQHWRLGRRAAADATRSDRESDGDAGVSVPSPHRHIVGD